MLGWLHSRLTYANVAATLALCAAVGSGGYAIGATSVSPRTVTACASKSGALSLARGARCKQGQQKVSWDIQGPPGSQGAQGTQGAQGAPGTPGTPAPTYSAGTGLTLANNTFSADLTSVQHRLTGGCPPGSAVQTVTQEGTVSCQATGFNHINEVVASGEAKPEIAYCGAGEVVFGGGAYAFTGQITGSYAFFHASSVPNAWQAYATSGVVQARAL
jgi:hypothetical protein